jgi:hypothetical protein
VQTVPWFGVSPVLPTATTFLAFSGFLSAVMFVTAKHTTSSSKLYANSSMARHRAS